MAEIKVKNLHKEFGVGEDRVVALENVNLEIEGHVFVSIVGPSGCGKSTLLNILTGIETPSSGSVTITQNGAEATPGYVFQAARLLPWRSVMDNLLFVQKEQDEARFVDWTHLLFEQAMLAEGGQLEDPASFVQRLNGLLLTLTQ